MKGSLRISLTTILLGATAIFGTQNTVQAQPCYSGFDHRLPIELDNSYNSKLENYEVKLSLSTSTLISAGKMKSLGQDIRFLDGLGSELDYWIEDGTINSTSTVIWVKVDSLPNYAKDTIYMYYGNSSALPKSDAQATFQLVDEFNGSTLSSVWGSCGSGTVALSGGKLKLTSNSSTARITTSKGISGPVIVELHGVSSSGGTAVVGQINTSNAGFAITHDGTSMQMASIANGSSCLNKSTYGSTTTSSLTGDWSFVWSGSEQTASLPGKSVSTTNTTYSMTNKTSIVIANDGAYGILEIDYLRVRKYTAKEPSVSFGTEQNMKFTISASYTSPLCAGGVLELGVNTVSGATYSWTGPNGFKSKLQSPQITGVSTSDAGRYDLTVEISSGCASKSTSVNVNISPKAVGGTVGGAQTICAGSNSGLLSLSGQTGNVLRWDSSTNASGPWVSISNTGLNQSYSNLTVSTYFRAMVVNGSCSIDSSSIVKITVTPPSVGGSMSGSDSVCASANSGILSVNSFTGNVIRWETSTNGNLWNTITNKGTTQAFVNLKQTTYYRAAVQNGNCDIVYSSLGTIQVDELTVGGTINGGATVCPDANSGWLVLTGNRGSIVRWETTQVGSSLWSSITNSNDSLAYTNLSKSMVYRALIKNGSCGADLSSSSVITVLSRSNAGTISGGKEVCESANSGTLTLSGINGTIQKWQKKTISTSWNDIANTSTSQKWYNLTDTTDYRAIVSNGSCKSDTSAKATVLVNPTSEGGYIDGVSEVCIGTNSVDLKTKATVGNITEWQTSATGYSPWTIITNTTKQLSQSNLSNDTYYRVKVRNGVCASVYSTTKKIEVNALSNAGNIVESLQVCEGTNFGIIKIAGETGQVVKWQKRYSMTAAWQDETNNSTKYEVQNISKTVYLRAIVKNRVCMADTSKTGSVEVSKYSRSGDIYGDQQLCSEINDGNVEIKDNQGDVLFWEFSENNGANWNRVVSNKTIYTYKNLATTTVFRAVVKNGVCPQDITQFATIEISNSSNAGHLTSTDSVLCFEINNGTIQLVGHEGNVVDWQRKEGAASWMSTQNQTNKQVYSNILNSVQFRAIVKNNYCPNDTTDAFGLTVSPTSIGGDIVGDMEACEDVGTSSLNLQNHVGHIDGWQSGKALNGPWSDLGATTESLLLDNSGPTKFYRVAVTSGVCPKAYSQVFRHTVFEKTLGGEINGGKEVCKGNNEGILELNGSNGEILDWETLNEDGTWSTINFKGDLFWFENLTESTTYRARVQNGLCVEAFSEVASILTNPVPVVDFTTTNPCEDQVISFSDLSTIGFGNIIESIWEFSDGFTSQATTFDRIFQVPGKYNITLTAQSDKGCIERLDRELFVAETPTAFFRINNGVSQSSACLGVDIQLEDLTTFSDKTDLEFDWKFGNGNTSNIANPTTQFNMSGSYNIVLTVNTRNNCSDKHTMNYLVLDEIKPTAVDDIEASLGIGAQLNAKGSITYRWQPEEFVSDPTIPNPIATVTESTQFVVTGTDYYGCESMDSVWVMVTEDYTVIPSNVITPDGNLENDVWVVQNIENYPKNNVSVFDRWGREVFTAKGYQNDWGATNRNGHLLMDGTYYYVLEFPEVDKIIKGAITVVRNN